MPKPKSPNPRGKSTKQPIPTEEKVGPMRVVRRPPEERKRLPPELEAFAQSDEKRISRPRPAPRLDDPRAVYLVPGVANRHARAVYDAHLPLIQGIVEALPHDEDGEARAALGEALAHAARTGFWRGRSITGFDAFVEGVLGLEPKLARTIVEEVVGEFPEALPERTVAMWMRVEAAFAEVGAAPGAQLEVSEEGTLLVMAVPVGHASAALTAAAQLVAPFAREDEEARAQAPRSAPASAGDWRADARKVNEGADLENATAHADDHADDAESDETTPAALEDSDEETLESDASEDADGDESDADDADDVDEADEDEEDGDADEADEDEADEDEADEDEGDEDEEGDDADEVDEADEDEADEDEDGDDEADEDEDGDDAGEVVENAAPASTGGGWGKRAAKPAGRDERGARRDGPPPRSFGGPPRDDRGPRRDGSPPRKFGGAPRDDRGPRRDGPPPRSFGGPPRDDRGPRSFGGPPRDDRGPRRDGPPPRKFGGPPRDDRGPRSFGGPPRDDRGPRRDGPPPRKFGGDAPSRPRRDAPPGGGFGAPRPRGPKKR